MSFVNEFISDEDVEKYRIEEIDEKFVSNGTRARDWTIDRDRDVYLRNVAIGGGAEPELRNRMSWTLYWHGDLIVLRLDLISGGEDADGAGWAQWKLMWLNGSSGLPLHLKEQRTQILADLKDALTAYRSFGIYSREWPSYQVILEVDEGCVI
ncbi:hypothetical protein [Pseudomonas sp. CGJS7]|uniref:hypothetical protein n=1 Tax=Pseudomonas sp. CGJS7 TaxID=3109348 RepID=UPI003008AE30